MTKARERINRLKAEVEFLRSHLKGWKKLKDLEAKFEEQWNKRNDGNQS